MKSFARRPSPALVIACVALGIALAGTSYATVLQVPTNSVGTPQLKNGAVTTSKLRSGAVTTTKVRNGTLVKADFRGGQLPAGPPGPAGPAGPAGPPGLSGVERVEVTTVSNSAQSKTAEMACASGKRLLGGGARLNGAFWNDVVMTHSFPDNDNVYRARAVEVTPTNGAWSLTVFAVCAVTS